MASKIVYEVVASTGTYTDRDGNEKKRYVTCGKVFENDQGYLSIKLDTVPVGPEWSGWFSLFEPKARETSPMTAHSTGKGNAFQPQSDDDVPF